MLQAQLQRARQLDEPRLSAALGQRPVALPLPVLVEVAQAQAGHAIECTLHLRQAVLGAVEHAPVTPLPLLAAQLPAHPLQLGAWLAERVAPAGAGQLQRRGIVQITVQGRLCIAEAVANGAHRHLPHIALESGDGAGQFAQLAFVLTGDGIGAEHAVEHAVSGQPQQGEDGNGDQQLQQGEASLQ